MKEKRLRELLPVISIIVISLALSAFFAILKSRLGKKEIKGAVRISVGMPIVGATGLVFLVALLVSSLYSREDLWVILGFAIGIFLCIWLIVYYINYKITFDQQGFVIRNFFRKHSGYSYGDITFIDEGVGDQPTVVFIGDIKIKLDSSHTNYDAFLTLARNNMQEATNSNLKNHLISKSSKFFRGNVNHPSFWIGIFISMTALIITILVVVQQIPIPQQNHPITLTVQGYTIEGGNLLLNADQSDTPFAISDYKDQMQDYKVFLSELKKGDTVSSYIVDDLENIPDGWLSIELYSLTKDGKVYLDYDQVLRYSKEGKKWLIISVVTALVLWVFFMLLTIDILRNPKRYPRRLSTFYIKFFAESDESEDGYREQGNIRLPFN
jgi:hypothetical protein